MINPNKNYKVQQLAKIIKIDPVDSYIPYLTVQLDSGVTCEGSLKGCHSQWKRLKVGDRVAVKVQWSITMDKFMISRVIRKKLT